jgi:hypothetical protein
LERISSSQVLDLCCTQIAVGFIPDEILNAPFLEPPFYVRGHKISDEVLGELPRVRNTLSGSWV